MSTTSRRLSGLLLLLLCLSILECQAQREYFNWYFGNRAGITFLGGVRPLLDGNSRIYLQGASQSDSTGRFVFASDGNRVFDRQGTLLANGDSIGEQNFVSVRDVLSVRQPGSANRYYIFNEINNRGGAFFPAFSYSVVDISQNGGLGRVVEKRRIVRLPSNLNGAGSQLLSYSKSDFAMIRHANGRDQWLILQNAQRQYLSFRLATTGLDTIPIVSLAARGPINSGAGQISNASLRASPDGRRLLVSDVEHVYGVRNQRQVLTKYLTTELTDFDSQSGRVSNPMEIIENFIPRTQTQVMSMLGVAGASFSPDGSKMYLDTVNSREVWQYNLLAGSPTAIGASRTVCGRIQYPSQGTSNLQLGPDGKIYVANNQDYIGRIETPNAPGVASQYRDSAVFLGAQRSAYNFLPRTTNDLNLPPVVVSGAGSISAGTTCAGETVQFTSSLSPFLTATAYAWNFGDPASGPLNQAMEQAPIHRYTQAGTYTVRLVVTATTGQAFVTSQVVQVLTLPAVDLGPDLLQCADEPRTISPGPQPMGSTYRWHDGSTGAEFSARLAGTYRVTVTSPQGCVATDELRVILADCPVLPTIITPNGDALNQAFVLKGLNAPDWNLRLYNRWGREIYQQASYDNRWDAPSQSDGVYFYQLRHRTTGQVLKGWVEVRR